MSHNFQLSLPIKLTQLEEAGLSLADSISIMDQTSLEIDKIPGEKGEKLQKKFHAVLARNPDYSTLRSISEVIQGSGSDMPEGMSPKDIANFKFCPTVSVDVERSFSIYKNILTDKRHSLTKENVRKMIVTHCYYKCETD